MAETLAPKEKKKRKLNFSVSEKNVLTNRVNENLDILQSKFTNYITNQRKNKIWEEIRTEVNSIGVDQRTTQEVKDKWKNLQSSAKKSFSVIRRQEMQTGGGPPPKPASPLTEKIMKMFETTPLFTGLDGFETAVALNTGDDSASCTMVSALCDDAVSFASLENNAVQVPAIFYADDEEEEDSRVPESLPSLSVSKPALPPASRKEKMKRVTNQEVLQLHAEVLKSKSEVLQLKQKKLELEILLLQRQV